MQIGDRDFRSGNEISRFSIDRMGDLKEILFKFWKLSRSQHAGSIDNIGYHDLGVAVVLRAIEEKIDQCPLQFCDGSS